MSERYFNIFITHAWRFHRDWTELTKILNTIEGDTWTNFSVPWYDPAIRVHSEGGQKELERQLYSQILPAKLIIFLLGPYQTNSARYWFDLQIQISIELKKRVVLLQPLQNELRIEKHPDIEAPCIDWKIESLRAAALGH